MINDIQNDAQQRMQKTIEALQNDLTKLRTGRANTAILDSIMVDYYGNPTPINQVANVAVGDSRTLTVTPWEKPMAAVVEKAIRDSDLGLNPATAGQIIRVPMPPLTEERRRDLTKLVKQEGEGAKVAVRNVRRDANNHLKDLLKDKDISEDDERRGQDLIQKLTDKFVAEIDKMIAEKEADVMAV